MAKRRTRKDKVQARRPVYRLETTTAAPAGVSGVPAVSTVKPAELLLTNTRAIKGDLAKSILISGLILGIELTIYWFLVLK